MFGKNLRQTLSPETNHESPKTTKTRRKKGRGRDFMLMTGRGGMFLTFIEVYRIPKTFYSAYMKIVKVFRLYEVAKITVGLSVLNIEI
jgi:hypothetical protein